MWYFVILFIFQLQEFLKIGTSASFFHNIRITRPPNDYFPRSGNLKLICMAEGSPMPTINWHDSRTKFPVQYDDAIDLKIYPEQGLLIISNPKPKTTYEFYCNASNDKTWVVSNSVKTGISYLSSTYKIQPKSIQILKELQSVILSCQLPDGNPIPFSKWFKDQRELLKYSIQDDPQRFVFSNNENGNCSMQIKHLKLADSGEYHCVANNDYQVLESTSAWVLVMNSFSDLIFDISIKQISHKTGDDVEILCDPNNNNYNINNNNKNKNFNNININIINNNSNNNKNNYDNIKWISSIGRIEYKYLYSNKLFKQNVKFEDRGIYACVTNNSNSKLINIFNLTITHSDVNEEKVKILKKVVIEGVNVMLECDLENTKAGYYWETPQSLPIFPNDFNHPRFRVTKDGFLNILNAQSLDTGKYTCNVHNSLDVKHKSVWLEVSKMQLDTYPVISLPAQNLTVVQGSDINLRCEVIGDDIVKIIWYSGLNIKERIVKDWQVSFPTKENLLILNAQSKTNTNFYTCEAINEQGLKATWTAYVKVVTSLSEVFSFNFNDLPLPPVVEIPKNIKSSSLELFWSSNNNPNWKVLYWIEYVHFGSKNGWEIYRKNWPHNFITIENLKPDTWYQFLVRSKTNIGIGRASVPTEYVKTKNFMSDEPYSGNVGFQFTKIKLIEPEITNDHKIQLKWYLNKEEETGFKSTSYTQFYLNYRSVSILKCIVDKFNGNPYDSTMIPALNNYCSLKSMNTETLKILDFNFSPNIDKDFQVPIDFQKINLTKSIHFPGNSYAQVSWFIPNVTFFNCYNISILSKSIHKSLVSNSKLILVPETKPSQPPEGIQVSWLTEESMNVKWDLPDRQFWNGIITGSKIYLKSNESEIVLKFNDSSQNKIISQVNSKLNWLIRISIANCVGESGTSRPVVLNRMSEDLQLNLDSLDIDNSQKINLFKKSWMIATLVVTSVLVWLMLSFLTVYLCCSKSFRIPGHKFFNVKTSESNETPVSKNLKEGLISNPNNDKENSFNENDNEKTFNVNSLGLSSATSNLFCNPYASTQIFEPLSDNRTIEMANEYVRPSWAEQEKMNLYYLSSPIFDSTTMGDVGHNSANFFAPNNQEYLDLKSSQNPTISNNNHLIPFSLYRTPDETTNSQSNLHFENKSSPRKEQFVELSVLKNNGMISNLLISTAPFSDQFTTSSKSKSTNNSSNSDSSHHQLTNEHVPRMKKTNVQTKPNKRRHDPGDFYDQSTEMTHLLAHNPDNRSPFASKDPNHVYDIPYSDTVSIIDKDN